MKSCEVLMDHLRSDWERFGGAEGSNPDLRIANTLGPLSWFAGVIAVAIFFQHAWYRTVPLIVWPFAFETFNNSHTVVNK